MRRHLKPRAIAIPLAAQDERWLRMIHALLALLAPLFFLLLVSCQPVDNGVPVEYGPEIDPDAINQAAGEALMNSDPYAIQKGQFVRRAHTQELAMSGKRSVISDNGLTVIDRIETDTQITYVVVEKKIIYGEEGKYSESNPFQWTDTVKKPQPGTTPQASADGTQELSAAQKLLLKEAARLEGRVSASAEEEPRSTYHRLTTSVVEVAPPPSVQSQPNCGDVPNCRIRVTKLSYDQVIWNIPEGNRLRYEFELSTDVPYYARFMNQCVTQLVQIPNSKSTVLVKECTPVESFRFKSPAP